MSVVRITTLVAPASSYALVDLSTVKDELQIPETDTANDNFLNRAINQVSGAISRYCNRSASVADEASFPIEMVADLFYPKRDAYPYQVPGGVQPLQLSHWPIANFVMLALFDEVVSGATILTFASTQGVVGPGMNQPAPLQTASIPFEYIVVSPTAGAPILMYTATQGFTLPEGLGGCIGNAGIVSTGTVVFDIADNGVTFGTMTFAEGETTATFTSSANQEVNAGDVLTITPQSSDATLSLLSGFLAVELTEPLPLSTAMPVSGLNIQPGTVVESVSGGSITLSLPTTGEITEGSLITFGISVVMTNDDGSQTLLVPGTDYQIDGPRGQLIRLDPNLSNPYPTLWWPMQYVVIYSGGFAAIPDDVQDAALRWVAQRWGERQRDPSIRSVEDPGVGTTTYWVGGPKMSGGVPENIASLLDRYRVPVSV